MQKCLQAGMDDCLEKPVSPESLSRVISKWVETAKPPVIQARKTAYGPRIFDYHGFKKRNSENAELMKEVAGFFREDAWAYLKAIKEASEARDTKTLQVKVHALKGAAANVGAIGLETSAKTLEKSIKNNKLAQPETHLNALETEYRLFLKTLREHGL
jgi:HPt (histidine-containing phosphotransfer) domain-containing protein